MQRVAGYRYLYRKDNTYYFRRAVPKHARNRFDGKSIHAVTLGVQTLSAARRAWADEIRQFEEKVADESRVADVSGRVVDVEMRQPSREDIDEAVRAWLQNREARAMDDEIPALTGNEDAATDYCHRAEQTVSAVKSRGRPIQLLTHWLAENLAKERGWSLPEDGPLRAYLQNRIVRAEAEWSRVAQAEVSMEPRPVPDAIFAPDLYRQDAERASKRKSTRRVPIMELFEAYVAEAKLAPASIKAFRSCLQSLIDHLGHSDAAKVTKADIVAWKEVLIQPDAKGKARSGKTVRDKYLAAASAVFGWAEGNLKIEHNPVHRVTISVPRRVRLRTEPGLNDGEAAIVLGAALNALPDRRSPLRGFARRWIPWLCAYSGARVGEIAQLRAEDIYQHDEGPWCMRVTPEAGGQKRKQARDVPIHPHLIEQGFLDAVAGKSGYLFFDPLLHRGGKDGNPQSKKVAERLCDWVRKLGVDDPEVQPNHGWRHRFKRVARSVRMDHEARDNIQDHAARTEGDKYGGTTIQFRFEELCKHPRYELPARGGASQP